MMAMTREEKAKNDVIVSVFNIYIYIFKIEIFQASRWVKDLSLELENGHPVLVLADKHGST